LRYYFNFCNLVNSYYDFYIYIFANWILKGIFFTIKIIKKINPNPKNIKATIYYILNIGSAVVWVINDNSKTGTLNNIKFNIVRKIDPAKLINIIILKFTK
jgi:hypothetical protein